MEPLALPLPVVLDEPPEAVQPGALTRPLDLWWGGGAATLVPVSLIWDFSWESTIGVDRFWSPPHLATHLGVWLSGLLGLRLVLVFTLARRRGGPAAGINLGPLSAPAGAWILLWSALELQAAFLFDNWWQQAYGLGAGLWHPPQILKATGFFSLLFGALMLSRSVRTQSSRTPHVTSLFLCWHGGLLLALCTLVMTMTNYPNLQHTASFYLVSCAIYPAVLLALARAQPGPWGATCTAWAYMALVSAMVWLLPLFPARPLTPPINNPMDHMMPPPFPLLLVVPGLALDLLTARFKRPGELARKFANWTKSSLMNASASAAGIGFFVVFVPLQWFFAKFLLTPAADNWFFAGGGRHWPFFLKIDQARVMFWGAKQDPLTWRWALLAVLFAMVSSWLGLRTGAWLNKLRR